MARLKVLEALITVLFFIQHDFDNEYILYFYYMDTKLTLKDCVIHDYHENEKITEYLYNIFTILYLYSIKCSTRLI